ncbi:hypothetical protein L798_11820 [Zootermopsis nevadensis]|uniref:Uncharacterized protein n=1 Tax=Zootermopsis nevadensis TaxID=136037 RepID=A0A067QVK2_ZOONE|nr:hypothetical protein L798_11820 [Zootermopsis nevadensis]
MILRAARYTQLPFGLLAFQVPGGLAPAKTFAAFSPLTCDRNTGLLQVASRFLLSPRLKRAYNRITKRRGVAETARISHTVDRNIFDISVQQPVSKRENKSKTQIKRDKVVPLYMCDIDT